MPHQSRKGTRIGVAVCIDEWREYVEARPFFLPRARKSLQVCFDPKRWIGRHAVFPASKPQQDEAQLVAPRFQNEAVNEGVIKFPFFGFEHLPGNGCEGGIDVL